MKDAQKEQTKDQEKALTLLQKHDSRLSTIDNSVNTIKSNLAAPVLLNEGLHQAIDVLQRKVASIPEATSNQFKALQEQLSGIASQIERSNAIPSNDPSNDLLNVRTGKRRSEAEESTSEAEVLDSITRLCDLVRHDATIRYDDEAQHIIDDIETILDSISKQLVRSSSVPTKSRKRPASAVGDSTIDARDLKRIKGLLIASSSIAINQRSSFLTLCLAH